MYRTNPHATNPIVDSGLASKYAPELMNPSTAYKLESPRNQGSENKGTANRNANPKNHPQPIISNPSIIEWSP